MENENSQINANNLDEPVVNSKNSITTSVENITDQSVIEIEKEVPIIEVLEETTSFVVEDTGVIHIKKQQVLTVNSVNKKQEEQTEKTDKANGPEATTDIKKEDSVLHKNESTIADVYLQLDITENLDNYLEKERARQLSLTKSIEEKGDQKEMDPSDKNKDDKKLSKHIKSSKKNESNSTEESSIPASHNATGIEVKTEASDTEAKNSVSKVDGAEKSEKPIEADKKDNRFLWVSNINKTAKATALKMHLSAHGKVHMTKIVTDGIDCFGYAVFETHEDANNCLANLQNSMFEDREIHLSDKVPEKKQIDKYSDKDLEKKKIESKVLDRRDVKVKSEIKKKSNPDPLTLRTDDERRHKRYSEERRRLHELERRRLKRERLSMERREMQIREMERKRRQMEREREREKERERQREARRRERIELEERRKAEMKIEKERKKLEYERQLIEKEKLELLRYKRKFLSKEKEPDREDRVDHKKHRSHDEYSRKKYPRTEEDTKHLSIGVTESYWKTDTNKTKSASFEIYKKPNQEICFTPPPPVLSNNYHERDRQWNERKDYDNRPKNYGRKMEDGRAYGNQPETRQSYPDRSFPKEPYKNKNFEAAQNHNVSWNGGYNEQNYKGQNIPVIRSEPIRSMPRHQNYQGDPCGAPMQNYFPGSNYRRPNDFFAHRVSDRKY